MNPNDVISNVIGCLNGKDFIINGFITLYFNLPNDLFVQLFTALKLNNAALNFNDIAGKSSLFNKLQHLRQYYRS